MPTEAELQAQIATLKAEIDGLKQSTGNKAGSIVRSAADTLLKAVQEVATVEVQTIVDNAALADLLAGKTITSTNVQGAFTKVDMLQGDITAAYSTNATSGEIKKLHDEAVEKGTAILRENMRMLADVIDKLWDRATS